MPSPTCAVKTHALCVRVVVDGMGGGLAPSRLACAHSPGSTAQGSAAGRGHPEAQKRRLSPGPVSCSSCLLDTEAPNELTWAQPLLSK